MHDGGSSHELRVGLVHHQPLMLEGLEHALCAVEGIAVCMRGRTGRDAVRRAALTRADLLVIEPWMPSGDGLEAIEAIAAMRPSITCVALSSVQDPARVDTVLAAGAVAYLDAATPPEDLPTLLRHAHAGVVIRPPGARTQQFDALTKREREVLALTELGLTNPEIGRRLFVTPQTVKFHLGNIFRKIGVHNRTQAAIAAREGGLTHEAAPPA